MSSPHPNPSTARPADILPRLGAGAIDLLVLFMQYNAVVFLFSLASYVLAFVGRRLGLGRPIFQAAHVIYQIGWIWSGLVAVLYFPYWWARGGRTFGMRLFKLRLVKARGDDHEVGWIRAALRWVLSLLSLSVLALGFLWVLIDERRQGWHDKLAGTLVVRAETDTRV